MTCEIIIPFHGRLDLLRRCLNALGNKHTIILVDDCSPEAIELPVLRLKQRTGFVGAVNYAWTRCTKDVVIVLNSDTLPGPNLINKLIAVLKHDKSIAAVAPASDNRQDLFQYRECTSAPGTYSFTSYLTAACLAIRREAIKTKQLFDPAYAPGYFEDLDLCCRLKQDGWKLAILESERIHHEGAATFGCEPQLENILQNNYSRFSNQWGYLSEHNNLESLL